MFFMYASGQATAMLPYHNPDVAAYNHKKVTEVYSKLSKGEKLIFKDIVEESYKVGYYGSLEGFSHGMEVDCLYKQSESRVQKMYDSWSYKSILHKAGVSQQGIIHYFAQWHQVGRRDAQQRNDDKDRHYMEPGDILSSYYREGGPSFFCLFGKVMIALFVAIFVLATIATISTLVGACCFPQKHIVFKKVRMLLEY